MRHSRHRRRKVARPQVPERIFSSGQVEELVGVLRDVAERAVAA